MPASQPKRVAVIGGGCAGIASFWGLQNSIHDAHLFEASPCLGGRIKTRSFEYGDNLVDTDSEPLLFNAETSPNLVSLRRNLGISTSPEPFKFCTSVAADTFEWGYSKLKAVIRHPCSLETYRILFDIVRFKHLAVDVLTDQSRSDRQHGTRTLSTHAYLRKEGFSDVFRDKYLTPLLSMLWGMNAARILPQFPFEELCRLLYHHRLLCVPHFGAKWRGIKSGASLLVQRMARDFAVAKVHLNTSVSEVRPSGKGQFSLLTSDGRKWQFDHVIFAVDAQECIKILGSAILSEELDILKEMRMSNHIAVLHSDPLLIPRTHLSPFNYIISPSSHGPIPKSCLTYTPSTLRDRISITLDPFTPPDIRSVHVIWQYTDYEISPATLSALRLLPSIQNKRGLSFCASWSGLGFLEDAVTAGLTLAVDHLGAELPFELDYHRRLGDDDDVPLAGLRLSTMEQVLRILVGLVRVYVLTFEIFLAVSGILYVPFVRAVRRQRGWGLRGGLW